MGFLKWVYGRLGQIVCFSLGGFFLITGLLNSYDGERALIVGGVLIATALFLRFQMLRRPAELQRFQPAPSPVKAPAAPAVRSDSDPPIERSLPQAAPAPAKPDESIPYSPKDVAALASEIRPLEGMAYPLRFWLWAMVVFQGAQIAIIAAVYPAIHAAAIGAEIDPLQYEILRFAQQWGVFVDWLARIALLAAAFVYCRFVYRALRNHRLMNWRGNETTPVMGVVWNFVPLANLFIPYMVMTEIWHTARTAAGRNQQIGTSFVFWWLPLIVAAISSAASNAIDRGLGSYVTPSPQMYQLMIAFTAGFIVALTISAISLIGIVRVISSAHDEGRRRYMAKLEVIERLSPQADSPHKADEFAPA